MSTAELKRKILELIREDEEFRYALAGALGLEEILKRLDENTKAIKSLQQQVASLQQQVVSLQDQVASMQEQMLSMQERLEQHAKAMEELGRRMEQLARSISAIGARWGILTESTFRNAIKSLVEDYFGGKVDRWVYYDEEGEVFGHPAVIEVDLVVRDDKHILMEVKSNITKGDVYELWKAAQLYERKHGIKPELAVVTAYIEDKAVELCRRLGVKVCTELR